MSDSFFGTDGIRGRTSLETVEEQEAIELLDVHRTLTPAFMRVLGEALSHCQPAMPGEGETVVIGWDDRPHNEDLVAALTLGLRLTGSRVLHIGLCATPSLHHAVLAFGARMGCMITASHNPVSDSGIKVFDALGYKSNPDLEREISISLRQLAEEDREVDQADQLELAQPDEFHPDWAPSAHKAWLSQRWTMFEQAFGGCVDTLKAGGLAVPLLLDSAGGFARSWLSRFLNERGVACEEVSGEVEALNKHCGAGDFSPTQTWTHEQAAASNHALLRRLSPAPAGQWVGAALDGDGDRCLLIEATATGYKVVDGDAVAALLMAASTSSGWRFAASIESDIALPSHVCTLDAEATTMETAVGDRWLAYALRGDDASPLEAATMPCMLGVEDSGHIVLPAPHPSQKEAWSLVGDGAATLCAMLLSMDRGRSTSFVRGWKKRTSVLDSHRDRWHAQSEVFASVTDLVMAALSADGFVSQQRRITGEADLLLVHATSDEHVVSFGVRNSGTQAKTSVSVRLSPGLEAGPFEDLLERVVQNLTVALTDD